ncbi:MAG TPA: HEAT repeat domain-containing protein [Allosphingosinicella sp.]|nr:HEAT repeat domain-containing protein [Allosphingosinicella sp.]
MIASAALAAWLADRDGQKRSQAAGDAMARDWRRHPIVTGLERRLATLSERSAEAVLAAAREFIDNEDDIASFMSQLIAANRADPFFRPPFVPTSSDIHSGLLLFHNPDLSIALAASGVDMLAAKKAGPRGSTSIGFSGVVTLFRYLRAGGATMSFWEAPTITGDFLATRAGKCRFVGRRRIEDGEDILLDGRYQSFVVEHAESDMLCFQALVRREAAPLAAEYDSKTLSFVGASSTDEASSRVQMMISMLRVMGRGDALPLIVEALDSPHFYTRWHIMRELLAMDAEAALPLLRRMAAHDPHPEVRAAACQTFDMFFADEEGEVAAKQEAPRPAVDGESQCRA